MLNTGGETPIQLTFNPHTIHELIRFGANPTDVYASRVHLDTKNPPQPIVKVFIVGNPSVGKISTLTAALKIELSSLAKIFISTNEFQELNRRQQASFLMNLTVRSLDQSHCMILLVIENSTVAILPYYRIQSSHLLQFLLWLSICRRIMKN